MRGGAAHPLPSEASDEAAAGGGWGRLLVEINESELTAQRLPITWCKHLAPAGFRLPVMPWMQSWEEIHTVGSCDWV